MQNIPGMCKFNFLAFKLRATENIQSQITRELLGPCWQHTTMVCIGHKIKCENAHLMFARNPVFSHKSFKMSYLNFSSEIERKINI
jgi:hypothetical protein